MMHTKNLRNSKCKLCELSKTCRTVCIVGSGPVPCKLMFIGESPGEDEDRQGKVFVGKTGQLLNSIFFGTEIKREEVYITNVLKCHPPYNSKPNQHTVDTCSEAYLRREIALVKPQLIVVLGSMAAKTLLQDGTIKLEAVREKIWYTKGPLPKGIPFIVTYHPAATFHQPYLLKDIASDFEFAKGLLEGKLPKPREKSKYKRVKSIFDISGIRDAKWIDLDLETHGLDPFYSDRNILSIQLSIKEGEAYYLNWNNKIAEELKELLTVVSRLNGFNFKFDLKWLRCKVGINVDDLVINDTSQNLHLIDENFPSKALDVVAPSFTDMKAYKGKFQQLIRHYVKMHKEKKEGIKLATARLYKEAFRAIDLKTRVNYGCGDADAAGKLRRYFRPLLKEQGLIPLHRLMMNAVKMYVDIECNGFKIDVPKLHKFEERYGREVSETLMLLDKLAPYPVKHTSNPQLKQLIYGHWRCEAHLVRVGKLKKRYSTSKDALELILKDQIFKDTEDYLRKLLEFRKLGKLYNTYIKGMPRFLRDGDLIHTTYRLDGTDSGRTSSSDPNLQNIPRKGDIKEMFTSRWDDGVLIGFDCSQGELRIAAHESREPNLCRLFNSGVADIHRAVAALVLDKKETKVTEEERYCAKQVNFAVLYGAGASTTAQEMVEYGISEDDAYKFIRKWHKMFPGWRDHVTAVERFIIDNNFICNAYGRYRHLYILDPQSNEGATNLRIGVNAQIQGGLSDYNKQCGYNVYRRIRKFNRQVLMVAEVHDQFIVDAKKKYTKDVVEIVKEEFENVDTSDFGFKFRVPMKVDVKVGPNWKDMEVYVDS